MIQKNEEGRTTESKSTVYCFIQEYE
jgi:hypothetical protein